MESGNNWKIPVDCCKWSYILEACKMWRPSTDTKQKACNAKAAAKILLCVIDDLFRSLESVKQLRLSNCVLCPIRSCKPFLSTLSALRIIVNSDEN